MDGEHMRLLEKQTMWPPYSHPVATASLLATLIASDKEFKKGNGR